MSDPMGYLIVFFGFVVALWAVGAIREWINEVDRKLRMYRMKRYENFRHY
jgi:hypothetical protein